MATFAAPTPVPDTATSRDDSSQSDRIDEKIGEHDGAPFAALYDVGAAEPLAPAEERAPSLGHQFLVLLHLRKPGARPDLEAIATQESVFDGPFGSFYRPHPKWENNAVWDPAFRWTYREERQATRKADWTILLTILLCFLALDIDRGNMTNATADNILKDLGLTTDDYNVGVTLSKAGFLIAELPSQMVGKKLGVDIWLPAQLCIFSVFAAAQFWLRGRTSFLAFRFVIGFFQGGFIPDAILYLSYFYTKNQLPVRLALFWTVNYGTNVITGLLGAGLIEMRGVAGQAGWRWMFLLEGIFTLFIGIASFFLLPPGPSQTKAPWRPNGYFTDRQVKVIVNRVLRDDPTKGSMHNRQALTFDLLWESFKDYDLWPMYVVGLMFGIPGYPVSQYFQLSMKQLGFSTLMSNLLSVPNAVISIINLVLLTIASEVFDHRTVLSSVENIWFLIFYIALRTLPNPVQPWTWFAIATLLLGFPYAHAIQVAWCSRNSGSVRTRTVSASIYNMCVQLSAIIGANVYQPSDAPRYYKANSALLGIIAFNLAIMYPGVYIYYRSRNAYKEKRWNKMSQAEKEFYLESTTDEGAKRLDFRFAY